MSINCNVHYFPSYLFKMSQSNENHTENIQIDSNVTAVPHFFAPCGVNSASESEAFTDGNIAQNESIGPSYSPDNILVCLADDCMIKVFEYLPLRDLCNVADVCSVFESNALSVFKRRYSDLDLDELLHASEGEDESERDGMDVRKRRYNSVEKYIRHLQMKTVEKLFRHFGSYIRTINLTVEDHQKDEIFELLATYCTHKDAKLKKLKMNGVTIGPGLIPRIQSLFDRLNFLNVTGGSFSSFYIGPELTELILEDVHLDRPLTQKLEKLRTLSLIDVQESCSEALDSVLALTPQLKRLTIRGRTLPKLSSLPSELEELELDVLLESEDIKKDISNLARLHLKVFSLNCMGLSMTMRLNNC